MERKDKLIEGTRRGLNRRRIVMVTTPAASYQRDVTDLAFFLAKKYGKTIYVSINKPYKTLAEELKEKDIDPNRFHFIDCVTRTLAIEEPAENCTFIDSPDAIEELVKAISAAIDNHKPMVLLFDSIVTLLAYHNAQEAVKFAHTIVSLLNLKNVKGLFPYPKEELDTDLAKDLEMFADEVIDLGTGI